METVVAEDPEEDMCASKPTIFTTLLRVRYGTFMIFLARAVYSSVCPQRHSS